MTRRPFLIFAALATVGAPGVSAQAIDDNPTRRWEFFRLKRAWPFQEIPAGALQRARSQLLSRTGALRAAPPPIQGTQWQPVGPLGIPINGASIGRLTTIAVDPTNSNVIYIGGAQGGVWKTVDGGSSWTPLTDQECSLAMGWIAIDPVNPSIVYAGTGEQHFSGDSYYGCGVLRSTDGGATWTQLGAGVFRSATGGARISRILIAPGTAGTPATTRLIVASDFGLYRSTNGGETWSGERLVTGLGCVPPSPNCAVTDLALHPANDAVVYAAVRAAGVFRSADGGLSWQPTGGLGATGPFGRLNLALAPSGPDTLYAALEGTGGSLLGISRSIDGGSSWTFLGTGGANCGSQCWYDMIIAVDPRDANDVYFGGVALFRSTNAAQSFQPITNGIHVDQHVLTFDPQDPGTLYAGNDGGIFRTRDAGASWASLNRGLALTQFYEGISLHPSDAVIVLGGTQDNGTLTSTGLPDWSHVLGGDGGYTAIDADASWIRYAETQWNASFGGPRRSDGGPFDRKVNGINTGEGALFIPPLVMHPTESRTLYFGTSRLYRTGNRAELWSAIGPAVTGVVTAIGPAAESPDIVYAAWTGGQLYVTTDGGASWAARASGIPNRFITDIAVDRGDWRTAWVVVSGFGTGHVFRTTDAGQTWSDVSGALPDVPVNAVLADPADRGFVMIGTDLGVFVSPDSGGTWTVLDQGMPNVAVFDIAYNPATATLIAATHGRGMFSLQLNRPLTLAVVPGRRADTTFVGNTGLRPDSADVLLTGIGAATAGWSATHTGASWLTLATASGTSSGRLRWSRDPAGLTAGVYVDTITVSATGAQDSPTLVIDTLLVAMPLALALQPATGNDTIPAGSLAPVRADSATVQLSGFQHDSTAWTASHQSPQWLTLTTAAGMGTGVVRWRRDASSLLPGVYVGRITVVAPGAAGSPATIVDSLVVAAPPLFAFPSMHTDTVRIGEAAGRPDSALVSLTGAGADTTTWTAGPVSGTWLTLGTGSGTGPGMLRWTRHATALPTGSHVDTVVITSSRGDAARLVDRFVVRPLPIALDPASGVDTAISGGVALYGGTLEVVLEGGDDTTTAWNVTHGPATWLTLRTVSGRGTGTVEWIMRSHDLQPGAYHDTLVVATATADSARFATRLVVEAPTVTRDCAAAAAFGGTCLGGPAERYLDLLGNDDGRYNLGDFIAYLRRTGVEP